MNTNYNFVVKNKTIRMTQYYYNDVQYEIIKILTLYYKNVSNDLFAQVIFTIFGQTF